MKLTKDEEIEVQRQQKLKYYNRVVELEKELKNLPSKQLLEDMRKQVNETENRIKQILVEYDRRSEENYELKQKIIQLEEMLGLYNGEPF